TYSHYDSLLTTAGGVELELTGDSEAAFASLDHVIYRDQDSKFSGYTTLTRKSTNNFIENAKLDVSSRTLTVLDLGVNYSTVALGGSVSLSGGYSRGLDLFGAEEDAAGLPGSAPKAEFSKLTVSAGYYKPFNLFEENMLYSSQFSGQYALDTLFGSEQFSAGGIYTVRGFYEEVLANDHGAYLRNDLAVMLPIDSLFGQAATLKPYIGLDAGAVHGRASGTATGVLVGAAVGVALMSGPISFDIYTGYPLSMPDDVENEHFNTFARLSVNF
ncbi:MAG: ShlB/FhaC/HecB family hemolysin secretion/activation protein, partial [Alphaproteobacteria bacterium]|nr:ShlB/FhaC/HecB family hemolysin secretion/activation protein [Alphaproteobacteria bacterium]